MRRLEIEAQRVAGGKMPGELDPGVALTVEHIMPKSLGKEWEKEIKNDAEFHADCLFRLGNICLLTGVNKELGRKAFDEKKKVYATSKLITTNGVAKFSQWNRKNVDQRQQELAKLAVAAWRFS